MKALILALAFVALAVPSFAQTVTGTLATITNGTTGVSTTSTLPPAAIACGQVKAVSGTVNPTKLAWNDSTDATKDCIYTDPGAGLLLSLPFGPTSYTVTLQAVSAAGTSPPSLPTLPFTRPGLPPGAPTAVRTAN